MRTTSKKLLLWLYSADPHWAMPSAEVEYLLPDLTPGGRRSLVAHLQAEQYLATETLLNETRLRLTDHGRRTVAAEFPAFSDPLAQWQGDWAVLVFLTAPAADPRFRNLRKVVLEQGAGQLTRGVYLYPGQFPAPVQALCQQLYRGQVMIGSVNGWQFGDERGVVGQMFLLSDAAETLSGISREISELLNSPMPSFGWSHGQKQRLFTVFDRLCAFAEADLGLVSHYFPQVPSSRALLAKLQQLMLPLA